MESDNKVISLLTVVTASNMKAPGPRIERKCLFLQKDSDPITVALHYPLIRPYS